MRSHSLAAMLASAHLAAAAIAASPSTPAPEPAKKGRATKAEKKAAKRARTRGVQPSVDLLALAKSCGATTYTNRHLPGEPAVAFGNESWARFCAAVAGVKGPEHG